MPTHIPTTFSRHNKTFIKVANGTIVVTPMRGGDEYWISAPGQRQQRVGVRELPSIVRELVHLCGGPIPYMPCRDQFENTPLKIVNTLLEADPDDPETFIQREVERRSEPIKKLEIVGRRWYRRGPGGVYCKAYIYINDKLVHVTPEQYGYGDHYLTLAKDWLTRNGYLEGLIDERDPIWYLRDKHGIDLRYQIIDVKRERDL